MRYQTALHSVNGFRTARVPSTLPNVSAKMLGVLNLYMAILTRLKLVTPLRQRGVISIHYKTLVCQVRIELTTFGLRDRYSTTELLAQIIITAKIGHSMHPADSLL
jgi:hypothetical protein